MTEFKLACVCLLKFGFVWKVDVRVCVFVCMCVPNYYSIRSLSISEEYNTCSYAYEISISQMISDFHTLFQVILCDLTCSKHIYIPVCMQMNTFTFILLGQIDN